MKHPKHPTYKLTAAEIWFIYFIGIVSMLFILAFFKAFIYVVLT